MAQGLRICTSLAEDPSVVPNTVPGSLQLPVALVPEEIQFLWPLRAPTYASTHIYTST